MESLKEDRTTLLYFYQQVKSILSSSLQGHMTILSWGNEKTKLRFWKSHFRKLLLGTFPGSRSAVQPCFPHS